MQEVTILKQKVNDNKQMCVMIHLPNPMQTISWKSLYDQNKASIKKTTI